MKTISAAGLLVLSSVLALPQAAIAQIEQGAPRQLMQDIEGYLNGPELSQARASADNGVPHEMVFVSDALEREFGSRLGGQAAILPIQLRYLMGAVEKGHGPAFHRLGEIVWLGRTPEGGPMDALGFFEQGARAGDTDSVLSYFRLARDLKVCSICQPGITKGSHQLVMEYTPEEQAIIDTKNFFSVEHQTALDNAKRRALDQYMNEKRAMVQQALVFLGSDAMKNEWRARSALANAHIYGIKGADLPELRLGRFVQSDGPNFLVPEPAKAAPILQRFAQRGQKDALNFLSQLHLTGQFEGFPQDRDLFIRYTSQLAATGHVEAAHRLGNVMLIGEPFGTNFDLAAQYLYQAYEAGSAEAAGDLGYMFLSGSGIPKDDATALRLFIDGANRGSSKSADVVSQMHRDGVGTPVNGLLAEVYAKKAAENREAEANARALMADLNQLGQ